MSAFRTMAGFVGCLLSCWVGPALSFSEVTVVKPLSGYVCMSLKSAQKPNGWVTGALQKPFGGPDSPPVYSSPSTESARIGYEVTPIVNAVQPLETINGFLHIGWGQNAKSGWIDESLVMPYRSPANPNAKCAVVLLSNGRIGNEVK